MDGHSLKTNWKILVLSDIRMAVFVNVLGGSSKSVLVRELRK
jgi:hypothetical protein